MKNLLQTFLLKRKIAQISLRGRVAFCIDCLEMVVQKLNIQHEILEKLLQRFWEFISIDNQNFELFEWQEKLLNDKSEICQFMQRF